MAVKEILKLGDPRLRQTAEEVDLKRISKRNFRSLLQDMYDTMDANNGVGLAAPQIGISLRFFVKGFEETDRYPDQAGVEREVIINPTIEFLTEDVTDFWEGCLSVPGMQGLVRRPNHIKVQYWNEEGREIKKELKGFEAIVFQHEFDHLDGILYVDRLVDSKQFGFNDSLPMQD
jgi:peptide deformylase